MNPICSLTKESLELKSQQCLKNIALYETIRNVARIALPLLTLGTLTYFTYLNPIHLPIASALLIAAYSPCLQITVGTLDKWVADVRVILEHYQSIQHQLDNGASIFEAQVKALSDLPLPSIDTKRGECAQQPTSETLRFELLGLEKKCAYTKLTNARQQVKIAYIRHVEINQNAPSLSHFGSFKKWPIDCLLNEAPFAVFIASNARVFTNEDDFSQIFTR